MPASARRVVITGLGLISPVGSSKQALWDALSTGRSGVGALEAVPSKFLPTHVAAEAREFTSDIENFGALEKEQKKAIRKGLKVMCRECQMGVAAAQLALADAGLVVGGGKYDPDRTGCVFGADYMLTLPEEFSAGISKCRSADGLFDYNRWATEGMPQLSPLWLLKYLPNMPASHVAIYNDLRGPNNSITHREAAANLAVGEAYRTILRGSAEIMVVGATGTRVHPMKTVHAIQTEELATNGVEPAKASRPFDKNRTGMVLGEGAGAIVIEELATAQARGATILGEIVGHGSSHVADKNCVAHRDVALKNVMNNSLRGAGMSPGEVGHIHAHGLSTRSCDIDEAKAIREVFGSAADQVPVTAAKSYFGNLGAGSGMIELIASLLALSNGKLFPVLNYETPDPECPIRVVAPHNSSASPGHSFLNLSVTPQGQASGVLVRAMA
ncbi:MAG TPA: beta-ketoacyl-[acyl-carrier-protein] synthase family protein [Pirellulales bacterium]|nr:beta-ketoacyl-[acyl-carrier-protein] synthase family protein [Pirellulales bacterium]